MSPFEALAEERIKEAIESGEFDNLQGAGQPIDLDAYFATPSSFRAGFNLLKNAHAIPPEVEAMKQVNFLREKLDMASDPVVIAHIKMELQTRQTEVAMAIERMKMAIKADATY